MDERAGRTWQARTAGGPSGYERVALVLQGGGALGAYQAGVYQALAEAGKIGRAHV
jgi:NTE family protein